MTGGALMRGARNELTGKDARAFGQVVEGERDFCQKKKECTT